MVQYINGIEDAPQAIGPYSQAATADNLIFISGQIAIDPATGKLISGGIENETRRVLANLRAILEHQGLSFSNVCQSRIFVTDLQNFQTVNKIYAEFLGEARPARATVQASALPLGALVEIEMVAVK